MNVKRERRATARRTGRPNEEKPATTMNMPLFPLNHVVLFPRMVLPLHIFEPRYREMINHCLAEQLPFGVLLIKDGVEVGGEATPHTVGTAARIIRVERMDDGRMNITAVGGHRFRVKEFLHDQGYLSGVVEPFPLVNGGTRLADEIAHKVRPRLIEYVELLSKASQQKLKLDRLPEDATTLAFMVAIAMQLDHVDKQALLELAGVPEVLARELHLLSREMLLLGHMIDTYADIMAMSMGPTGYILPN